jgi:hemerythrin HHE cation binding domain-containing protein
MLVKSGRADGGGGLTMSPAQAQSSEQARTAILDHHTKLLHEMERRTGAVIAAAASGTPYEPPVLALGEFVADEILPHAEAEEQMLYPAAEAIPAAVLLIRAMKDDHRQLGSLAGRLAEDAGAVTAATTAASIATLFAMHVAKENDLVLPVLAEAGVDLNALLAGMHHLLG